MSNITDRKSRFKFQFKCWFDCECIKANQQADAVPTEPEMVIVQPFIGTKNIYRCLLKNKKAGVSQLACQSRPPPPKKKDVLLFRTLQPILTPTFPWEQLN